MVEGKDCLDLEQLHELNLSLIMMMQGHIMKHKVLCAHTLGPYKDRDQIIRAH